MSVQDREQAGEGLARSLVLLEQLFVELSMLGLDPLKMRSLKTAGDELVLAAAAIAMRNGLGSLPRVEFRAEWTILDSRDGIGELAQRFADCRVACSSRVSSAGELGTG